MNWLRRLISKLERRWIRDPDEREKHDVRVKRRLKGESAEDGPPPEPAAD
jgi:hypothetical protein